MPPQRRAAVAILTGALFLLVYVLAGFFYETNDDGIMDAIFRGILFPGARTREIGFAHKFTASVLGELYELAPSFPWYGASMYLLLGGAVAGMLSIIDRFLGPLRSLPGRAGILTLFFATFLADSVLFLNFTRVAVLLSGFSILAVQAAAARPGGARWPTLSAALLVFVIALLTRPDAAVLSLMTVGTFALLVAQPGERRTLIKFGFVLGAITAALYVNSLRSPRETHFRSVYPFLTSIHDFRSLRDDKLSFEDSLRLEAIKAWFFCDRDAVNVGFLSRVTSERLFTTEKLGGERVLHRSGQVMLELGPRMWLIVAANAGALAFALLGSSVPGRARILRLAAGHALFWAAVCLLAIIMKVAPRVLSPLMALYACASLATLTELGGPLLRKRTGRVLALAGALAALLGSFAGPAGTWNLAKTYGAGQRANQALFGELEAAPKGTIVILPLPALRALSHLDPLKGVPLDRNHRYVVFGGWPCLLAAFEEDAECISGSTRLPELLVGLRQAGALLLSDARSNRFLERYLRNLHGLRVSFTPLPSRAPAGDDQRRLTLYRFTALPMTHRSPPLDGEPP